MLTQARLQEVLDYDPETGVFTWKVSSRKGWVGKVAGHIQDDGYIRIRIDGVLYRASRLAWLYIHGAMPLNDVDHRNLNTEDNAILNLRDVTNSGNQQNQVKARVDNISTGLLGASLNRRTGKYRASISIHKKITHLGSFDTASEAHAAYVIAKRKLHETCML